MILEQVPTNIKESLQEIAEKTQIPVAEIETEYLKTYNDDFIQRDPQFKDDEDRMRYTTMIIKNRYLFRPPTKDYNIIPIGYSSPRATKKGTMMSEIFAFVQLQKGMEMRRIVLRDELASVTKNVELFCQYRVKLGEFQGSRDLIADGRSEFKDPVAMERQKVVERIPCKRVKIVEAAKYPSKKNESGYTDSLDWRVVRGIVNRHNRGPRKDQTEYGAYTIMDDSVDPERRVNPDGSMRNVGMTIWVPPEMIIWDNDSELDMYGTISLNKEGEASMNGNLIVPIHGKRLAA
jgi:hypothetical protein